MLNNHFYNQLSRKYVILFGDLFNNITLIRYDKVLSQEIERFRVPITFATKEKFIQKLYTDPHLDKSVQISLPRMSYEQTAMTYDPMRQKNKLLLNPQLVNQGIAQKQFVGVPYNLSLNLYIYARNIDDADQILEQIIPTFNPDFHV